MEITINKKQETVNDVAQEILYSVFIKRVYGSADSLKWSKDDWLHNFNETEMQELAQKLSDKFLTPKAE